MSTEKEEKTKNLYLRLLFNNWIELVYLKWRKLLSN